MLSFRLRISVFFVAAMVAAGEGARAEGIRYTFETTGDALVGFASYSDIPLTATFTGDTSNVVNTATSSVASFFTSVEYYSPGNFDVFSSDPSTLLITNDFLGERLLLTSTAGQINFYPSSSPLLNFQLQNAIGPQPIGWVGEIADTLTISEGFEFTSTPEVGTFSSTLGSIPEPTSLILLATGMACCAATTLRHGGSRVGSPRARLD
jgi:hypothetical protein